MLNTVMPYQSRILSLACFAGFTWLACSSAHPCLLYKLGVLTCLACFKKWRAWRTLLLVPNGFTNKFYLKLIHYACININFSIDHSYRLAINVSVCEKVKFLISSRNFCLLCPKISFFVAYNEIKQWIFHRFLGRSQF